MSLTKLFEFVTRDQLHHLLINQAAEANRMRSALEDVYALACGPSGARTNGLIRQKCMSALALKPGEQS